MPDRLLDAERDQAVARFVPDRRGSGPVMLGVTGGSRTRSPLSGTWATARRATVAHRSQCPPRESNSHPEGPAPQTGTSACSARRARGRRWSRTTDRRSTPISSRVPDHPGVNFLVQLWERKEEESNPCPVKDPPFSRRLPGHPGFTFQTNDDGRPVEYVVSLERPDERVQDTYIGDSRGESDRLDAREDARRAAPIARAAWRLAWACIRWLVTVCPLACPAGLPEHLQGREASRTRPNDFWSAITEALRGRTPAAAVAGVGGPRAGPR